MLKCQLNAKIADGNAANNSLTSTFTVIAVPAGAALPFVERFDKPLENRMMKCMKLKILIIGLICGSCIRCI